MNTLIVFKNPIILPVDSETVQTYGLVLQKERWEPSPYKAAFLLYIRVLAEMFKEGFKSIDGLEFEKDGEFFYYGDLTCKAFETMVEESGVQYAIVGDSNDLNEDDYMDELLTNQQKWSQLVGQAGLVWQR